MLRIALSGDCNGAIAISEDPNVAFSAIFSCATPFSLDFSLPLPDECFLHV